MLKRLYVDNFKCLVNFELSPRRTQLLLGDNGSGKSALFGAVWRLREVILGESKVAQAFPPTSLTRWDQRKEQSFELEVEGDGGTYLYKLLVEHKPPARQARIASESLSLNRKPLLTSQDGEVTIFREDQTVAGKFPFDWSQSAVVTLHENRSDNHPHRWFRDWVRRVQVLQLNPFDMEPSTDEEDERLDVQARNFVSWYRHVSQETLGLQELVRQSLAEIWEGFRGIRLETVGPNAKILKAAFRSASPGDNGDYELAFGDLSEGQRVLIALYTFLRFAEQSRFPLLCIDEPDNFVSLAEIQPWLRGMCQAAEDHEAQVLYISHHPELINYLAPQDALVLSRPAGGPTRVRPFESHSDSTLTPAEVIARGWDGE